MEKVIASDLKLRSELQFPQLKGKFPLHTRDSKGPHVCTAQKSILTAWFNSECVSWHWIDSSSSPSVSLLSDILWSNFYHRQKNQSHFLAPATAGWHRYVQFTHKQHAKMVLLTPTVCSNELPENLKIKSTVQNIWMQCLASTRNTAACLFFPFTENLITLVRNKEKRLCLISGFVLFVCLFF